jgi:hypothetical protein
LPPRLYYGGIDKIPGFLPHSIEDRD